MILVTGASGFIGRAVCKKLTDIGMTVRGVSRSSDAPYGVAEIVRMDLEGSPDLDSICKGVHTIVHLAGRAHVLNDDSTDPAAAFTSANVSVTKDLAAAALRQGVKRFIFLSSIGAVGSETDQGKSLSEATSCKPIQLYAVSKLNAELELTNLIRGTEMELVVIRPPLVYAGDAPGNFGRLLSIVRSGLPLPFLWVNNRRSMVALENLVDFIHACISNPLAANETFVISDGTELTTPQIIRLLAQGMARPARLFPVPVWMIGMGLGVLGRKAMYSQLCRSLVVDSTKASLLLGWTPPITSEKALAAAGADFMKKYDEERTGGKQ